MESLAYITLDMQAPALAVVVYAKQNDRLSRKIVAQLADGSAIWSVPGTASGVIRYHKPDGTGGYYDVDEDANPAVVVSGSIVTLTIAEQALTVPGDVFIELNFYDTAGAKLTAFAWVLRVQASVLEDTTIVSSDYYNVLTAQIASALQAAEDAEAAAASAAATIAGALRYDIAQTLTESQQTQAQTNLGAIAVPAVIENATLYVDDSTGDDTNDGTQAAPLKTISAAVGIAQTALQSRARITISIAAGTYAERVRIQSMGPEIELSMDGATTISCIDIQRATAYISGSGSLTLSYMSAVSPPWNGALLYVEHDAAVHVSLPTITVNPQSSAQAGVSIGDNARLLTQWPHTTLTVNSSVNGVQVGTGSLAVLQAVATPTTPVTQYGLSASGGSVISYNSIGTLGPTNLHTAYGGRIYSGAQTDAPNY